MLGEFQEFVPNMFHCFISKTFETWGQSFQTFSEKKLFFFTTCRHFNVRVKDMTVCCRHNYVDYHCSPNTRHADCKLTGLFKHFYQPLLFPTQITQWLSNHKRQLVFCNEWAHTYCRIWQLPLENNFYVGEGELLLYGWVLLHGVGNRGMHLALCFSGTSSPKACHLHAFLWAKPSKMSSPGTMNSDSIFPIWFQWKHRQPARVLCQDHLKKTFSSGYRLTQRRKTLCGILSILSEQRNHMQLQFMLIFAISVV